MSFSSPVEIKQVFLAIGKWCIFVQVYRRNHQSFLFKTKDKHIESTVWTCCYTQYVQSDFLAPLNRLRKSWSWWRHWCRHRVSCSWGSRCRRKSGNLFWPNLERCSSVCWSGREAARKEHYKIILSNTILYYTPVFSTHSFTPFWNIRWI